MPKNYTRSSVISPRGLKLPRMRIKVLRQVHGLVPDQVGMNSKIVPMHSKAVAMAQLSVSLSTGLELTQNYCSTAVCPCLAY